MTEEENKSRLEFAEMVELHGMKDQLEEMRAMREPKYMEREEINNIKKLLEDEGQMPASKRIRLGEGHHYNVLKKIVGKK